MLGITLVDVALFWVYSLGLFLALFWVFATVVYLIVLLPGTRFAFRGDLERKVAMARRLPSGRRIRWVYPYFVALMLLDNGVQATLMFRMSHWLAMHRMRVVAEAIHSFSKFVTNIDCSPYARVGPGLLFYHGTGAIVGKAARIGARVTVCQLASAGAHRMGDDVFIGAGAIVLPSATIGDRSEIGALSLVKGDVPADCFAVGIPAERFIPKARMAPGEGSVFGAREDPGT